MPFDDPMSLYEDSPQREWKWLRFAVLGTVSTFSWLQPSFRRRGLGTEMRAAMLHLAFAGRREPGQGDKLGLTPSRDNVTLSMWRR
jgi:RimJ/RimL family protein N-acetyltransferase